MNKPLNTEVLHQFITKLQFLYTLNWGLTLQLSSNNLNFGLYFFKWEKNVFLVLNNYIQKEIKGRAEKEV